MIIFIECDNDESVVRGLGFVKLQIKHHASKGRVAKELEKATVPVVALVDEDPGAGIPGYLRQFKEIEHLPGLHLRLLRHSRDPKWMVELRPDLEPWLIEAARRGHVSLKAHHLPETARELHMCSNSHADRLRQWTAAMVAAGSPEFLKLKQWLASGA
jgi:hypothetical protein